MPDPILHLASASPRRREILAALGIGFSAAGVDVDESRRRGEPAVEMAERLARDKAYAAAAHGQGHLPVLGADTVVAIDEQVLGKPASRQDALRMLDLLSGREHAVITAVALACADSIDTAIAHTIVRFRQIDPDEADRYWQSGEPADKAGAYAIQGLGGIFVESLAGSYSNVVGLPVFETAGLLRRAGIEILPASADGMPYDG